MKKNTNFSFVVKFHIRVLTRMKKIDIKFKNFLFLDTSLTKQITSFTFIEIVEIVS